MDFTSDANQSKGGTTSALENLILNKRGRGNRVENDEGLNKIDTHILKGYQLFHNYIRTQGIGKKTPEEKCGIKVEGNNKWKTLIENASI